MSILCVDNVLKIIFDTHVCFKNQKVKFEEISYFTHLMKYFDPSNEIASLV